MNWDAVGATGEVLGAIVVAITLIYLAVQTHLNKKAMEGKVLSNVLQAFSTSHQSLLNSEELAILNEKGHRNPSSLTKGETLRYFMLVRETTGAYYDMYSQFRNGVIDEQTWKSVRFDVYASQPGVRKFLSDQECIYDPEFIDYYKKLEIFTACDPVFLMTGGSASDT